jgi:ABC-type oligopeptide transport system ATPase subunit
MTSDRPPTLRRVSVVGSSGSGKTTVARANVEHTTT